MNLNELEEPEKRSFTVFSKLIETLYIIVSVIICLSFLRVTFGHF